MSASAEPSPTHGPLPAPLDPTGCHSVPSNQATLSARASPFAFWNVPVANTFELTLARPQMLVPAGNHPFVPAVFEPMALHCAPSHFATWSAWAMPATADPSV